MEILVYNFDGLDDWLFMACDTPYYVKPKGYLDSVPFNRAWRHDYFTSCRPTPQFGNPVTLPLLNNDDAVVELDVTNATNPISLKDFVTLLNPADGALSSVTTGGNAGRIRSAGTAADLTIDPDGNWVVPINDEAVPIVTGKQ